MFARSLMVGAAATVLAALTGCVATSPRAHLDSSTHRLEYQAAALAQEAGAPPAGTEYPSTYARDALALADGARALRHAAEDGASDADVQVAFDRVSRAYHAVRDEVEHSESTTARDNLQPVTEAYRDVEHDLGYPLREARADNRVPEDR